VVNIKEFEHFWAISMSSESFKNTEADLKEIFENFGANSKGIIAEFKENKAKNLKELQYFLADIKG
jgi:hypothetical protein